MIRQFSLAAAILGLAMSLAPAPTFADMVWLDRSAPDVDVTRRWWRNPMGAKAFYLGDTGCSIHATHAPRSIGQTTRSGCFAMRHADD